MNQFYIISDLKTLNLRLKIWQIIRKDVFLNILNDADLQTEYQDKWGRVGVNLFGRPWNPGIFAGFMLDGQDHKSTPVLGDDSPDFVIIISFESKLHNTYPQDDLYISFIIEMSQKINRIGNSWELYHHIADKNIEKHNYWHPVHIRKPVLELLRGTKTWNEQKKRVNDALADILPLVFNSDNFKRMREKFKKIL